MNKKLFFLVLLSFISLLGRAQSSGFQYFGTVWYLQKIEENNVVFNIPPYNGFEDWRFKIEHDEVNGVPTGEYVLQGEYCVGFIGPVEVGENYFKFIDEQFAYQLIMCGWTTPEDITMMNRQMNFYQDHLSHLFYFEIINSGTETMLIITNDAGNKAYYSTAPLSVEEPLEQFVKVYPNPFKECFFVEDYKEIIKEIKIFDNAGRIIQTVSEPTQAVREIHTHFASGIYFINIETKDGRTMNKKIIKK